MQNHFTWIFYALVLLICYPPVLSMRNRVVFANKEYAEELTMEGGPFINKFIGIHDSLHLVEKTVLKKHI